MIHLLLLAAILRLLGYRHQDYADVQQLLWVHYFLIAQLLYSSPVIGYGFVGFYRFDITTSCALSRFCRTSQPHSGKKSPQNCGGVFTVLAGVICLVPAYFAALVSTWRPDCGHRPWDELNPGSIERLVETDQLAFRVEFHGRKPTADELYWRSRIYDIFDGQSWRRRNNKEQAGFSRMSAPGANQLSYKIIAEPHQQRHLYSLGIPVALTYPQRTDTDAMLSSRTVLTQRSSFQLQSVLKAVPVVPQATDYINLQLPAGNEKSRQLARQLAAQYPQPDQLVFAIGRYLKEGDFRYSLTPPLLSGDQVDMFLWQSKTGFCSHYAQATTFLLRAAGVPARIVGGYLGGEWRDNQSYLEVSQRAAHAWVEYQHNGAWHRFDPTLQVAPDRLFSSLENLLSATDLLRLQGNWLGNVGFGKQLLQQLEDLDYYWSRWVLGFDSNQQESLLSSVKVRLQELLSLDWWFFSRIFARGALRLCCGLAVIWALVPPPPDNFQLVGCRTSWDYPKKA